MYTWRSDMQEFSFQCVNYIIYSFQTGSKSYDTEDEWHNLSAINHIALISYIGSIKFCENFIKIGVPINVHLTSAYYILKLNNTHIVYLSIINFINFIYLKIALKMSNKNFKNFINIDSIDQCND